MYAVVQDGVVQKTRGMPKWFDSDGNQITDNSVFIEDGIYPLDTTPPSYDPDTQYIQEQSMDKWTIETDYVKKTYDVIDRSLDDVKRIFVMKIENERINRTKLMPWTVPSTGTEVEVKLSEDAPSKPRQTWLSGTSSWGVAKVQEGNSDATDDLIAADDSTHTMTASEWVEFGKAIKSWIKDNLMTAKYHKGNIEDQTTVDDVVNYDYSTDWPS